MIYGYQEGVPFWWVERGSFPKFDIYFYRFGAIAILPRLVNILGLIPPFFSTIVLFKSQLLPPFFLSLFFQQTESKKNSKNKSRFAEELRIPGFFCSGRLRLAKPDVCRRRAGAGPWGLRSHGPHGGGRPAGGRPGLGCALFPFFCGRSYGFQNQNPKFERKK